LATHLLPQQDQHPGRYLIHLSFALTLAHVDLACERRIRQVMAASVRRFARPRVFLPRLCADETVEGSPLIGPTRPTALVRRRAIPGSCR